MDFLNQPQYWYFAMGAVWSIFQGARGVVETRLENPQAGAWKPLFLIRVIGVAGQLHSVVLMGKRPSTKSSR